MSQAGRHSKPNVGRVGRPVTSAAALRWHTDTANQDRHAVQGVSVRVPPPSAHHTHCLPTEQSPQPSTSTHPPSAHPTTAHLLILCLPLLLICRQVESLDDVVSSAHGFKRLAPRRPHRPLLPRRLLAQRRALCGLRGATKRGRQGSADWDWG